MAPLFLCSEYLLWVHFVFWPMSIWLTAWIATRNKFGLKDALLASLGLRAFERTIGINILHVATLLVPIALGVWIVQSCPR